MIAAAGFGSNNRNDDTVTLLSRARMTSPTGFMKSHACPMEVDRVGTESFQTRIGYLVYALCKDMRNR